MVTFNEHREPFMIKSLGCRLVALTGWTSTNLFGIGDFNAGFEQAECCEEIMLLTVFTRHTLCNQAPSWNVSFIFIRISKIDILNIYCKTQVPFYGSVFHFFLFHFHFFRRTLSNSYMMLYKSEINVSWDLQYRSAIN